MVFPSSSRKPQVLQEPLSTFAVLFPSLQRVQKPTAKLAQHFGKQRELIATWGLFVFTP